MKMGSIAMLCLLFLASSAYAGSEASVPAKAAVGSIVSPSSTPLSQAPASIRGFLGLMGHHSRTYTFQTQDDEHTGVHLVGSMSSDGLTNPLQASFLYLEQRRIPDMRERLLKQGGEEVKGQIIVPAGGDTGKIILDLATGIMMIKAKD